MPASSSLVLTALPAGTTRDASPSPRLSLLVSPRLDPAADPPRLGSFRDWLDWPAFVRECDAVITLGDRSVTVPLASAGGALGAPDSAAWRALFTETTPVRPFAVRDRRTDRVLSYDTVAAHALVERAWGEATLMAGDELPTAREWLADGTATRAVVDALFTKAAGIAGGRVHRGLRRVREGRASALGRDRDALLAAYTAARGVRLGGPGGADDMTSLLATAELFHMPLTAPRLQGYTTEQAGGDPAKEKTKWLAHVPTALPTVAQLVGGLDFHRIVAALNAYPRLLRLMGLVLDVTLPRGALAVRGDQPLTWRLERRGRRIRQAPVALVTRRRGDGFEAVSHGDAADGRYVVQGGLLRIAGRFALLQADVDGGLLKLAQFARTIAAMDTPVQAIDPVSRDARRAGAPTVRSAGFLLVQSQRARHLEQVNVLNAERDARLRAHFADERVAPPRLHAEDVVRGWRVDVWDDSVARWFSLCEREARYVLGDGAFVVESAREETTVRLAATTAADGSAPDLLSLHEAVAAWTGWSLAVRAPGRAVGRASGPDDTVRDAAPDVPPGLRLRTEFAIARGTLPRLRYGRKYAMRVRAVDLAGNSLPPNRDDFLGDDEPTTPLVPYLRLEPILAPVIALVRSAGALVSPPKEGESLACVAIRSFNDTFDDATPSPDAALRALVPPRTTVREAELHGMFDVAGKVDAAAYALLVARDAELGAVDLPEPVPGAPPRPVEPPRHRYAVHELGTALPYLPDPLCTRVAARFVDHPGIAPGAIIEIPLYAGGARWPDARPFAVRVVEGGGAPAYVEGVHELVVPLRKGVRCTLRLSCMPAPESLDTLGVLQWARDRLQAQGAPAARRAALTRAATAGKLWTLTPWVELDLVHATQRPIVRPDLVKFSTTRMPGATFARVAVDSARCSVATTTRLDLRAAWNEPRAGQTAPHNDLRSDVATTATIADPRRYRPGAGDDVPAEHQLTGPDTIQLTGRERRHEFGDTRYRRVVYSLEATSRFREFMPPSLLFDPPPRPLVPAVRTERHLVVQGLPTREWIPNSAPPPVPDVAYIVPTFGWFRSAAANGERRAVRQGRGLRIWLTGPWHASGWGEMLAVCVLPPAAAAGFAVDPSPYRRTVTLWGNDAFWKSPSVPGFGPRANDFPLARTATDPTGAWLPPGVPLTEADQPDAPFPVTSLVHPGIDVTATIGRVDVAPHDVRWDAARGMWYCDVTIAGTLAYAPFVRLALARYQPVSVPGAHLSAIVVADVSMLMPDRWLVVAPPDAAGNRRVTLHGPTHDGSGAQRELSTSELRPGSPSVATRNPVEAWIERLDPALGEDFGWTRVAALAVRPPVTTTPVPVPRPRVTAGAGATAESRYLALTADRRPLDVVGAEQAAIDALPFRLFEGIVPPVTGGARHRLVVAEYEEYLADDATPYDAYVERVDRRLVFVEHVELT